MTCSVGDKARVMLAKGIRGIEDVRGTKREGCRTHERAGHARVETVASTIKRITTTAAGATTPQVVKGSHVPTSETHPRRIGQQDEGTAGDEEYPWVRKKSPQDKREPACGWCYIQRVPTSLLTIGCTAPDCLRRIGELLLLIGNIGADVPHRFARFLYP
jgi:hypothetical protein